MKENQECSVLGCHREPTYRVVKHHISVERLYCEFHLENSYRRRDTMDVQEVN